MPLLRSHCLIDTKLIELRLNGLKEGTLLINLFLLCGKL